MLADGKFTAAVERAAGCTSATFGHRHSAALDVRVEHEWKVYLHFLIGCPRELRLRRLNQLVAQSRRLVPQGAALIQILTRRRRLQEHLRRFLAALKDATLLLIICSSSLLQEILRRDLLKGTSIDSNYVRRERKLAVHELRLLRLLASLILLINLHVA